VNNYAIVRQEHLNHYGFLFGGALLRWVDEYAWLVASLDFPGCPLVTVGMDQISFRRPVANGSILRFNIKPIKRGESSVQYSVDVFADAPGSSSEIPGSSAETDVFSTTITFAQVDSNGNKRPLPKKEKLRSEDEKG